EQAWKPSEHAGVRARGGQHDVARPRSDRGDEGEEKERNGPLCSRTLPPGVWASRTPDRAARVLNDRARGRSRAGLPARRRWKVSSCSAPRLPAGSARSTATPRTPAGSPAAAFKAGATGGGHG